MYNTWLLPRVAYRDDRGIFVAGKSLTIKIAREVTKNFGRRIPENRATACDGERESIVHDDHRNGRDQSHGRRERSSAMPGRYGADHRENTHFS
jgi:hypothetical protein